MGQMTDPQCMLHTAPATATGTDTAVVCETKHRQSTTNQVANSCHHNNAINYVIARGWQRAAALTTM